MKAYAALGILSFILFTMGDTFPGWPIAERMPIFETLGKIKWLFLAIAACCFYFASKSASPRPRIYPTSGLRRDELGDPLLILRLFAFLCVWITHSHISLKPNLELLKTGTMQFWAIGCAHSGMTIFFSLSGYLMAKAFSTGRYETNLAGIKSFYSNRLLRIAPLYFVAIVVVTVLAKPDLIFMKNAGEAWARNLFFNYYSSKDQVGPIGALWSLTTEMHFYLIIPFMFILFGQYLKTPKSALTGMAIFLTMGIIYRLAASKNGADWYAHRYTPMFANLDAFMGGFFLNGITGYFFRTRNRIGLKASTYLGGALVGIATLYLVGSAWAYSPLMPWFFKGYWGNVDLNHKYMQFMPTAVIMLTCLVIWLCEAAHIAHSHPNANQTSSKFSWPLQKATQFGGTITYSMYVWHPPILEAIGPRLTVQDSIPAYFARMIFILAGLTLWSTGSYYLIERPFEKMKTFGTIQK